MPSVGTRERMRGSVAELSHHPLPRVLAGTDGGVCDGRGAGEQVFVEIHGHSRLGNDRTGGRWCGDLVVAFQLHSGPDMLYV